jgi:hypothetical protein
VPGGTTTMGLTKAVATKTTSKKKVTEKEIEVIQVKIESIEVCLLGTSPLYFNRLAEKAKRELLFPSGRRVTSADRAQSYKHDPLNEFLSSVHKNPDGRPTRLCMPSPAFKGAMMTAALDLPGTKKAEIGRLLFIDGYTVDVYGIPYLKMDGVRTADINRTPDIRTRAFLPEWCCKIRVKYVLPKLSSSAIGNLLTAGGITCGVGDFRQEKGKGSFGQFEPVNEGYPEWKRIVKTMGRVAQDAALRNPQPFDEETRELFDWYNTEINKVTKTKSST